MRLLLKGMNSEACGELENRVCGSDSTKNVPSNPNQKQSGRGGWLGCENIHKNQLDQNDSLQVSRERTKKMWIIAFLSGGVSMPNFL